jgi:hypothetical protein
MELPPDRAKFDVANFYCFANDKALPLRKLDLTRFSLAEIAVIEGKADEATLKFHACVDEAKLYHRICKKFTSGASNSPNAVPLFSLRYAPNAPIGLEVVGKFLKDLSLEAFTQVVLKISLDELHKISDHLDNFATHCESESPKVDEVLVVKKISGADEFARKLFFRELSESQVSQYAWLRSSLILSLDIGKPLVSPKKSKPKFDVERICILALEKRNTGEGFVDGAKADNTQDSLLDSSFKPSPSDLYTDLRGAKRKRLNPGLDSTLAREFFVNSDR